MTPDKKLAEITARHEAVESGKAMTGFGDIQKAQHLNDIAKSQAHKDRAFLLSLIEKYDQAIIGLLDMV